MSEKLKMAITELAATKAYLNHMNSGSKKLDEILGAQIVSGNKYGLGFEYCASTSKNVDKFVQGKTLFDMNLTIYQPTLVNSETKTFVHQHKSIPICHFSGIMGQIRPHCNKLRNKLRSQRRNKTHLLNRSKQNPYGLASLTSAAMWS